MKKLALLSTFIMLFVMMTGALVPNDVAIAQEEFQTACDLMNDPMWDDGLWQAIGWSRPPPGLMFYAGDTVTVTAGAPFDGDPTEFYFIIDGSIVASTAFPGVLVWTAPADMQVTQLVISISRGAVTWSASCTPYQAPVPGCDVLIAIPASAVGGTFVADAPVYWAPGNMTEPPLTIGAGNTARVIGVDASGAYYKILWQCQFVWVPVNTMGPNYDAVWNGAPLPTGVVN